MQTIQASPVGFHPELDEFDVFQRITSISVSNEREKWAHYKLS